MLIVSSDQVSALRQLVRQQQAQQFIAWIVQHASLIGTMPEEVALQALAAARSEADAAGIDTQSRLFAYALAKALMPEMTGPQYLLALDAVFDGPTDLARTLLAIKARPNG